MIRTFSDFNEFRNAALELGVEVDLEALTKLGVLFFEPYKNFLILNVRDYGENPNNFLLLSKFESLFYSDKQFTSRDYKLYRLTMRQPFGESTVICLLAMREAMNSFSKKFEELHNRLDETEKNLDVDALDELGKSFRKLSDKLDDFVDLLLKLRDRKIPQVNTKYVSYDFNILAGKAQHTLDRTKNQLSRITGLRNELEVRATTELSANVEKLTFIMAYLTLASLVIAVPNTIATIFGVSTIAQIASVESVWFWLIALTILSIAVSFLLVMRWKKQKWKF